jgi:hypothetical protein
MMQLGWGVDRDCYFPLYLLEIKRFENNMEYSPDQLQNLVLGFAFHEVRYTDLKDRPSIYTYTYCTLYTCEHYIVLRIGVS